MFSLFSLHTQLFSVSLHTHTLARSLSRGVKMTREQSQVQCTLHEDLLPLKSQGINFFFFSAHPVKSCWKQNKRLQEFWRAAQNDILRKRNEFDLSISPFSKLNFFGSSHLRREETEEELSLLCFFFQPTAESLLCAA